MSDADSARIICKQLYKYRKTQWKINLRPDRKNAIIDPFQTPKKPKGKRMNKLSKLVVSAVVAGFMTSHAVRADDPAAGGAAPAATAEETKATAEKNHCKTKEHCMSKDGKKAKKKAAKAGAKDGCGSKDGCGAKEGAAPAPAPETK